MDQFKKYKDDVNLCLDAKTEYANETLKKYDKDLKINDIKLVLSNKEFEGIKNYYRYYIAVSLKLYDEGLEDFDCCNSVIDKLKKDYKNIKHKYGRYFIIDEKYVFETDTAFSFRTIFHDFLRKNYYDEFSEYLKYYKITTSNSKCYIYQAIYMLKNIDRFKFKEEDKKLLKKFNEFALLYHTYDNVILVPYGYNVARSSKFHDIYSLSMKNLIDVGFDRKLIQMYCGYDEKKYDINTYKEINQKLNPKSKVKMTNDEYDSYLNDAIAFAQKELKK